MKPKKDFSDITILIIKYLEDNINNDEQLLLDEWLDSDPKNRELLESFRDTGKIQEEINFMASLDADKAWKNIKNHKTSRKTSWPIISYAAAAVFLIALSFIFYKNRDIISSPHKKIAELTDTTDIMPGKQLATLKTSDGSTLILDSSVLDITEKDGAHIAARDGKLIYDNSNHTGTNTYNTLSTAAAGYYHLVLADGTKVWVNALSSLTFPVNFNTKERIVELTGEAYFEVAPDKNKPFKVKFNNTTVEVLGTHFNINSYDAISKTTLLEGAVAISKNGLKKILEPGQQAVCSPGSMDIKNTDTYKAVAWKEGVFYFDNDDLAEVTSQLSRWYDVKFIYNGQLSDKKLTGSIRRQATFSQVAEMLSTVSGATFTIKNRTVTISNTKD